eukprot:scaffold700_cov560-Prasinococcus_capsulatus_cf.AAC.9
MGFKWDGIRIHVSGASGVISARSYPEIAQLACPCPTLAALGSESAAPMLARATPGGRASLAHGRTDEACGGGPLRSRLDAAGAPASMAVARPSRASARRGWAASQSQPLQRSMIGKRASRLGVIVP